MQYEKSKRNNYTADFKREAVELVLSSGRNVPQIAAELGVSISIVVAGNANIRHRATRPFPARVACRLTKKRYAVSVGS